MYLQFTPPRLVQNSRKVAILPIRSELSSEAIRRPTSVVRLAAEALNFASQSHSCFSYFPGVYRLPQKYADLLRV